MGSGIVEMPVTGRDSQEVRQRSAKSLRSVRFRFTPPFFCLFDGLCHNSHRFHAGNLRQLEDFLFKVFTVPKAAGLFDEPSDLVVEPLHLRVADVPEGPARAFMPVRSFCGAKKRETREGELHRTPAAPSHGGTSRPYHPKSPRTLAKPAVRMYIIRNRHEPGAGTPESADAHGPSPAEERRRMTPLFRRSN